MIICGREFSPEVIGRIHKQGRGLSRRALSRQVCEWLDWKGPSGRWQTTNARIALKRLQRLGLVELPEPSPMFTAQPKAAVQPEALLELPPISGTLAQIGPVELVLVGSRHSQASRQCRELLERFHPQGARLCGMQLRYLIVCPRAILGVLCFSAAARRLRPRDQWIGWSDRARAENLHQVVNNSRFLLRPGVQVRHLASHVLGQAVRRLPRDWQQRYCYAPALLETFVDQARHRGSCYHASNWIELSETTAGRGRNDPEHRAGKPPKRIFLYPLVAKARQLLRQMPPQPRLARVQPHVRAPVEPRDWAEEEFCRVQLGDERLRKRLCAGRTSGEQRRARFLCSSPKQCTAELRRQSGQDQSRVSVFRPSAGDYGSGVALSLSGDGGAHGQGAGGAGAPGHDQFELQHAPGHGESGAHRDG